MLTSLLSGALSLLLGAAGWFIAKFLAEPLIAIYALRMETQEALIRYGNLKPDAHAEGRDAAARAFGDVGAKLSAHELAAWPWVKWACKRLRWHIYNAGGCCLELEPAIREHGFSHPNLWPMAPVLREQLRLPSWPKPTDLQRQLAELLSRPAPTGETSNFHSE